MTDKKMEIGAHTVELSNLDKVLFPDDGITKGDLIDYYQRIAEIMPPHLAGHPLSMQRFPNGIKAEGFHQKENPIISLTGSGASRSKLRETKSSSLKWYATTWRRSFTRAKRHAGLYFGAPSGRAWGL